MDKDNDTDIVILDSKGNRIKPKPGAIDKLKKLKKSFKNFFTFICRINSADSFILKQL